MTSLFLTHPKAQFLHPEKNKDIDLQTITMGSNKKLWFKCDQCHHDFEKIIKNLTGHQQWCSYCCVGSKRFCEDLDCQHCLNKSFSGHEKLKYWSSKNTADPRRLFKNTTTRYYFDCHVCGHEFLISPEKITQGCWCSYCGNQSLCEKDDCLFCFGNSFASHKLAKYWSDKNELKPRQIFKCTNKKFYFDCNRCHHDVLISINWMTNKKERRDTFCGYCGQTRLCDDDICEHCFQRSFSSHPRSKNWSKKNKLSPRQVFQKSNQKFYFDCDRCGHEFFKTLSQVANGKWCGKCKHKTEHLLYNFLLGHFDNLISQFSPEWFGRRRSDFCLDDIKVIIELDGEQHFKQVSNWTAPEITKQNDKMKMELANQHGYSVIRLLQPDVFNDKYDWKTELLEAIQVAKGSASPSNIFLCKDNEYDVYFEENGLKT